MRSRLWARGRRRWLLTSVVLVIAVAAVGIYLMLRPPPSPFDFLHGYDPQIETPMLGMHGKSAKEVAQDPLTEARVWMFRTSPERILRRIRAELTPEKGWQVEEEVERIPGYPHTWLTLRNPSGRLLCVYTDSVPVAVKQGPPPPGITCYVVTTEPRRR